MTYLTWRRERFLSALQRHRPATPSVMACGGDGGRAFNAFVRDLRQCMSDPEILAAASDQLIRNRSQLSEEQIEVLNGLQICLPVNLEEKGLARRLVDDYTHVQNHALDADEATLLVWDTSRSAAIESVPIEEVMRRYPCGPGRRWMPAALAALLETRHHLHRCTRVAMEIVTEDPTTKPNAGVVVLVVPQQPGVAPWSTTVAVPLCCEVLHGTSQADDTSARSESASSGQMAAPVASHPQGWA